MREILFRGKRLDNKEWVEGYVVFATGAFHQGRAYIMPTLYCAQICEPDKQEIMLGGFVEVDPDTIGQYTGLKDKNGKRIFEGDIIESDNGRERGIFVVRYGRFRPRTFYKLFEMFLGYTPKEDCFGVFGKSIKDGEEVILAKNKITTVLGNIHDQSLEAIYDKAAQRNTV